MRNVLLIGEDVEVRRFVAGIFEAVGKSDWTVFEAETLGNFDMHTHLIISCRMSFGENLELIGHTRFQQPPPYVIVIERDADTNHYPEKHVTLWRFSTPDDLSDKLVEAIVNFDMPDRWLR